MDWLLAIDWKSVEGVLALGLIANVVWSGLKWGGTKVIGWTQDYWASLSEEREKRRERLRARLEGDGFEQLHVRIRAGYSLVLSTASMILACVCLMGGVILSVNEGLHETFIWLTYVFGSAFGFLAIRNIWTFSERSRAVATVRDGTGGDTEMDG